MRKDDGRIISNFINQALAGKPISVYGNGSQTRSLCFVSDMVDGLMRMMFSPKTRGEVVNIGNTGEISVINIAKKIKQMTASTSEIVFKELPIDDPSRRKPDISKITGLTGWTPTVGLEEGLAKTIEYYKNSV
jgi:dTDP-glucose 4,6-dehydratase/UDP-glucuronate decarboxylase